ncbi:MAG: Na+/H+ antiporter NhaA [Campylobacterales bacterium]|nr:Na+/H+ antiporter NhaA [Campylobacterales bacterium]
MYDACSTLTCQHALFALANAGISINFLQIDQAILEPVALGIISGLVLGKVLGIAGVAYIATKLGIAQLPQDSNMSQVFGVALLGGIGFSRAWRVSLAAFYCKTIKFLYRVKFSSFALFL